MTHTQAIAAIRAMGLSVRRTDGEYRIAFKAPNNEASAYYTCDATDAVNTAKVMQDELALLQSKL